MRDGLEILCLPRFSIVRDSFADCEFKTAPVRQKILLLGRVFFSHQHGKVHPCSRARSDAVRRGGLIILCVAGEAQTPSNGL